MNYMCVTILSSIFKAFLPMTPSDVFHETYHISALSVQYLLEKVLSELTFCEVSPEKRIELFSKECRFIMEVSGARRGDTLTGV